MLMLMDINIININWAIVNINWAIVNIKVINIMAIVDYFKDILRKLNYLVSYIIIAFHINFFYSHF